MDQEIDSNYAILSQAQNMHQRLNHGEMQCRIVADMHVTIVSDSCFHIKNLSQQQSAAR